MEIFVIKAADVNNIQPELLENFKHKNFTNKKKEKEHCLAYLMLDRILKEVYKTENRKIEFIDKKPYLVSREKYFSISNSNDYLVIAFSDYECGIDIEKVKNRDYISISKRMQFSAQTLEEFYFDWTKYEAEYKLGNTNKSIKQTIFNDYVITAVSANIAEPFDIYIQNGETFPNL